jgi:hypothetical protein
MMKKRVLIVVAAMGLAALATCVGRMQGQRNQVQGGGSGSSQAQGSELQGPQVHGTAVAPQRLYVEGVHVVGGQLVATSRVSVACHPREGCAVDRVHGPTVSAPE